MNGDSSQDAFDIAIEEARTVLNHQIDLVERVERETLRIIYISLLILGAFLPVLQFLLQSHTASPTPTSVIMWVTVAAILLLTTLYISMLAYRSKLFYAGYEDSPTMNWRTITNSDLGPAGSSIPDVRDVDLQGTGDEFKKRLLWDYARGIRHNNLESTHRYRVHHDITRLLILVLSISTLGVALILMDRSVLLWPLLIVGSIISIYVIQRTLSDYRTLLNRVDDPERFSLDDYQDHHMLERNKWQDNRSEY